ncbi:MAG TPA: hypothetical protein VGX24_14505 [Pyrinomonadaceae bacterium]|jgi:hypothetical protein|nr:hypothetical protein [Pyrinomonadaceae bacterium]
MPQDRGTSGEKVKEKVAHNLLLAPVAAATMNFMQSSLALDNLRPG